MVWLVRQYSIVARFCTQPPWASVSSLEARIIPPLLVAFAGRDWRKSKLYHIRIGATRIEILDNVSPHHSQDSERTSRTAVDEHSGRGNDHNARPLADSSQGDQYTSPYAPVEVCTTWSVTKGPPVAFRFWLWTAFVDGIGDFAQSLESGKHPPHTRVL